MAMIDWNIYNATQDSPGGPVIIYRPDDDGAVIEPYRDEDGSPTMGGQIGYSLALMILLGSFLYFRYAI